MFLASAVRAAGFTPALRLRMSPELLVDQPFRQLARAAEQLREHAEADGADSAARAAPAGAVPARAARHLPALRGERARPPRGARRLGRRRLRGRPAERTHAPHRRAAQLRRSAASRRARSSACSLTWCAPPASAAASARCSRSHYSLLARKVAERSAETGEHYITRDRAEYRAMLRAAAGGGAVLGRHHAAEVPAGGVGLTAFWGGFAAG